MDTIPSSRSGPSPTRRLAGRCVALAALIFLGLQGAQHAYYFQNTAHVELQLLQVEDFALVGVEVEASGRVLLTPRLAEDVLKLLSPVQRQVFLADTGPWLEWWNHAAADLFIRECVGRIGGEDERGQRNLIFVVGADDRLVSEVVGRALTESILQFHARRRIEQDMVEVNRLRAEITKLGDQATEEMRQKLRAMSFGSFRTTTGIRAVKPSSPGADEDKQFISRRFLRLATWNASFAFLVGATVLGVCVLRRR